jgi:hypothetical protein
MRGCLETVLVVFVGLALLDALGKDTLSEQLPIFGAIAAVLLGWTLIQRWRARNGAA